MDEQWQYVGCHSGRMLKKEKGKGDYWLWAAIDARIRDDTQQALALLTDSQESRALAWIVTKCGDVKLTPKLTLPPPMSETWTRPRKSVCRKGI